MKKLCICACIWIGCSIAIISSCKKEIRPGEQEQHDLMVAKLDSIITDARQNPLKYFYANEFRLTYLDSLVQANPGIPQLLFYYAIEYQNSRDIERSIPILEDLSRFMIDSESRRMTSEALAISYLRLAEVNNCFENYTPANCILPFDEKAIHQNKTYVQAAMGHLRYLLESHPGNYSHNWMYNIAHVANGTYPDSVEHDFLIPGMQNVEPIPDYLDAPLFNDIGMMNGVGDNRISGSSCVEDFTGNGHLDIFTTSYGLTDQVIFYEGTGVVSFEDKTIAAGLEGIMGGLNIECADLNNSGFADVLILRGAWLANHGEHPNSLLRNNGDGTFTDITLSSGLFEMMPSQVVAFADVNRNGYLDIFIGNESESTWQGYFVQEGQEPKSYTSAIFLNNGDHTFTRHETLEGFELDDFVKGAMWGDINNDGLPDLYVSVMGGNNKLFAHRGLDDDGLPMFEEIAAKAGVTDPQFSFPVWFFDFNNNGLDDILVITYDLRAINRVADEVARERLGLEITSEFPKLFKNLGNETFEDITDQAGLNKVMFGMGANFGDVNNNGFPDIYIGNGAPDLTSIVPNRLFINHQGERFYETTGYSGVGHLQKGHGVSFADFGDDGKLDMYAVLGGAVEGDFYHNALFKNQSDFGNWVSIELEGSRSNRQGIGAHIEVVVQDENGERSIFRRVSTGGSFGANNTRAHVGLGRADAIERIIIKWPGIDLDTDTDGIQIIQNPQINRHHLIKQDIDG